MTAPIDKLLEQEVHWEMIGLNGCLAEGVMG